MFPGRIERGGAALKFGNSDTRGFTADRWSTANDLVHLSKADRSLAGHVTTHRAFDLYMKEATSNTTNASQLAALQSITQIYRALLSFEYLIKGSVDSDRVDTSSLWAMTYLNVRVRLLAVSDGGSKLGLTFFISCRSTQATSSGAPRGG
jgi:hypothetical protein